MEQLPPESPEVRFVKVGKPVDRQGSPSLAPAMMVSIVDAVRQRMNGTAHLLPDIISYERAFAELHARARGEDPDNLHCEYVASTPLKSADEQKKMSEKWQAALQQSNGDYILARTIVTQM